MRDDLVSFIDFAPTMLSIAGTEIPARMQGQVFLGDRRQKSASTSSLRETGWIKLLIAYAPCATNSSSTCATSTPNCPTRNASLTTRRTGQCECGGDAREGKLSRPTRYSSRRQARGGTLRHAGRLG